MNFVSEEYIRSTIEKYYSFEQSFVPKWYYYQVVTPVYVFQNFINFSIIKGKLIIVSVRGELSKNKMLEFLKTVEESNKNIYIDALVKIDKILYKEMKMNGIMFLPYKYHSLFETQDKDLYLNTIVAFPIYNCEFKGDESSDTIKFLRRDMISTVDWNREISPKIKIRYNNLKTQSRTRGNKFYFVSLRNVLFELDNMLNIDAFLESFIEVENYKDEYIHISAIGYNVFLIRTKDNVTILQDTIERIKTFVIDFVIK